jgi:hypothetical protein
MSEIHNLRSQTGIKVVLGKTPPFGLSTMWDGESDLWERLHDHIT